MGIPQARFLSAIALLMFAASLAIWCAFDTRPPAWDETVHLQLALDYKQWLLHGESFESRWTAIYPPLYHLSLIPSLMIGAPDADRAMLTHVLYFAVLLWGLLHLSKRFTGSPGLGLLAAVVLMAMPTILWATRRPLLDFALTAWVVAGMEWLLRTEGMRERRAVIVFGIWSGLGVLIKPLYAMWFVGPLLFCLWQGRQGVVRRWPIKSLLGSLMLCAAVAMLLALPYYGWQGVMFLRNASQLATTQGAMEGDPGFHTLAGWWWYAQALQKQMGWPVLTLLTVGCAAAVWRSHKEFVVRWLGLWMVAGYVLFTFNHNKDLRYTMPLLPPLVMLGLFGLRQLMLSVRPHSRVGWLAGGVAVLLFCWNAVRIDPPRAEQWQHQALVTVLQTHRDPGEEYLRVALVSNHPAFFPRTVEWSSQASGQPMHVSFGVNPDADFNEFIVLKSGDVYSDKAVAGREKLLASRSFNEYFTRVALLPLPDGSVASVYHRDAGHVFKLDGLSKQTIETKLHAELERFVAGPFEVMVSGDEAALKRGRIDHLSIKGGPWTIRGIPVAAGNIQLRDARFNLYALWDGQGIGLVDFSAAMPCLNVSANQLVHYLQTKQRKLSDVTIDMHNGHLLAAARRSGWRVAVELRMAVESDRQHLGMMLDRFSVGSISLPGWVLGRAHRQRVSLVPDAAIPGRIEVGEVHADAGLLRMGCD